MSHRRRTLALLGPTFKKGLELGRHAFLLVFPLSFCMTALEFGLRPKAQPTFVDITDWAMSFFFFLGLLALTALHAGIVLQLNASRKGQVLGVGLALTQGIERGIRVFAVTLAYCFLTLIGLLCFILPGLYLGVALYFVLFLAALEDYPVALPWYRKLKNYFSESFQVTWGHWWLTFGMLLLIMFAIGIVEQICFLILQRNLVLASLSCILIRAALLPFWYGWVLVLLFELKKTH